MSDAPTGNGGPRIQPSASQLHEARLLLRAGFRSRYSEREEPADELCDVGKFVVRELAEGAQNPSLTAEERNLAAYHLGELIKVAAEGLSGAVPQLVADGRQEAAMGFFRGLLGAVRAFNSSARTSPEFYRLALVYGFWPCLVSLSGAPDGEQHIEKMQRYVLRQKVRSGPGRKADFGGFAMRQVLFDRLNLEDRGVRVTWRTMKIALSGRRSMIEYDPGYVPYSNRKRANEEKDGAWISFLGDAQQAFETLNGARKRRRK